MVLQGKFLNELPGNLTNIETKIIRLRQIRIGQTECMIPDELVMAYGEDCIDMLSPSNIQTNLFKPKWRHLGTDNTSILRLMQDRRDYGPFLFQTAEESKSYQTLGKIRL